MPRSPSPLFAETASQTFTVLSDEVASRKILQDRDVPWKWRCTVSNSHSRYFDSLCTAAWRACAIKSFEVDVLESDFFGELQVEETWGC